MTCFHTRGYTIYIDPKSENFRVRMLNAEVVLDHDVAAATMQLWAPSALAVAVRQIEELEAQLRKKALKTKADKILPIESAPRDESVIDLFRIERDKVFRFTECSWYQYCSRDDADGHRNEPGWRHRNGYFFPDDARLIGWLPIPQLTVEAQGEEL